MESASTDARKTNGASRTRTGDLLGAIQALSQLSYSPTCEWVIYLTGNQEDLTTGFALKDTLSRG